MYPRDTMWLKVFRADAVSKQNGKCKYCKCPITMATATADHAWPRARNGGTTRNNIVACCEHCNKTKGDRSHVEFYKLIDRRIPHGANADILMIWASRRIWRRAWTAKANIERRAQ